MPTFWLPYSLLILDFNIAKKKKREIWWRMKEEKEKNKNEMKNEKQRRGVSAWTLPLRSIGFCDSFSNNLKMSGYTFVPLIPSEAWLVRSKLRNFILLRTTFYWFVEICPHCMLKWVGFLPPWSFCFRLGVFPPTIVYKEALPLSFWGKKRKDFWEV